MVVTMASLATARRGGSALIVAGSRRRMPLLAASARPSTVPNVVAVLPRQFSGKPPPPGASRERSEFREAKLPTDNIEFKETGFLTTIDRLANIMFMAEIFRALWLSAEVRPVVDGNGNFGLLLHQVDIQGRSL